MGGCGQKGAGPAESWCSSFLLRFGFPLFPGISHLHRRPTGGEIRSLFDRLSWKRQGLAISHQRQRLFSSCIPPEAPAAALGTRYPLQCRGAAASCRARGLGYNNSEAPGACGGAGAGDTLHAPLPDAGRLISGCLFPCSPLSLSHQGGTIPRAWLCRY